MGRVGAHRHFADDLPAREVEEERVVRGGDEQAATVDTEAQLVDRVDVLVEEALRGRLRRRRRRGRDCAVGAGASRARALAARGLGGGRAVVRRVARQRRDGGAGGRRGGET